MAPTNTGSCQRIKKEELREYRDSNESNGKGRKLSAKGGSYNKPPPKQVAATLSAQIDKRIEDKLKTAEAEATSEEQLRTFLVALANGTKAASTANASSTVALPPPPATATPPVAPLMTLQSIMKGAKN